MIWYVLPWLGIRYGRYLRQGNNTIGREGYLGMGLMDSKQRRLIAECVWKDKV